MEDHEPIGLHVRLLPDPPLWSWELIENTTHRVVHSSWNDDWMAYESPDAAVRAARASLSGVRRPLRWLDEGREPQRRIA
jgi:hypothetical protein